MDPAPQNHILPHAKFPFGILPTSWLAESQKGTLHEGECDFVVLDPSNGLLFIEVKGGTLRYVQEKDGWERLLEDGRKHILKKSPFDQCSRNMFTLLDPIG